MPTRAERPPLGKAVKEVAERASALARLEVELAGLEVKRKAGALGSAAGLGLGALALVWFGFAFLLATVAAALATFLPVWLSLVIVTAGLLLLAGILGLLALRAARAGTPPVPEQAIEEARRTTAVLRGNGSV